MSEPRDYEDMWESGELVDGVDEPADPLDDVPELEDDILAPDPLVGEDELEQPPYGVVDEPPS
jgi:hypothetical protein